VGRVRRLLRLVVYSAACAGAAAINCVAQKGTPSEPTVWTAMNRPQQDVVSLQCRGGEGYEFKNLGIKATATAPADVRVAVALTFAANTGAAGSKNENLQPGSCAPADRPLTPAEPRELHFITSAFAQPFPGPIDVTPTAAEYHSDVRGIADYLRDPAKYWTFHASDTHRGYFDVTIHEFWTDRAAPPRNRVSDRLAALTAVRWLLRVTVSGGIAGSRREVSMNGDGRVQASGSGTFGDVQCAAAVAKPEVQHVEATMARSHPESWPKAYPLKGDGCCDRLQYLLHVDREDGAGRRTSYETTWLSQNASTVPEPVSALFNLVYEARRACVF
jgi:hypothetical protein